MSHVRLSSIIVLSAFLLEMRLSGRRFFVGRLEMVLIIWEGILCNFDGQLFWNPLCISVSLSTGGAKEPESTNCRQLWSN